MKDIKEHEGLVADCSSEKQEHAHSSAVAGNDGASTYPTSISNAAVNGGL